MLLPVLALLLTISSPQLNSKGADLPAMNLITNLSRGHFDAVEKTFDPNMHAAIPEPKLKSAWSDVLTDAGACQRVLSSKSVRSGNYEVVQLTYEFEKEKVSATVTFDSDGKVAGLYFRPASLAAQKFKTPAKALIKNLSNNNFDAVEATFNIVMKQSFPKSSMKSFWNGMSSQVGKFENITSVSETWKGPYTVEIVACQFQKATVDATVSFDASGKVAGLFFKPRQG